MSRFGHDSDGSCGPCRPGPGVLALHGCRRRIPGRQGDDCRGEQAVSRNARHRARDPGPCGRTAPADPGLADGAIRRRFIRSISVSRWASWRRPGGPWTSRTSGRTSTETVSFREGIRRIITFDGKHVAIPIDMSIVNNVFYNKSVFEKLGLAPPKTWRNGTRSAQSSRPTTSAASRMAPAGPGASTTCIRPCLRRWARTVIGSSRGARSLSRALSSGRPSTSTESCGLPGTTWRTGRPPNGRDGADQLMRGNVGMYMVGDWASGYMKERGFEARRRL